MSKPSHFFFAALLNLGLAAAAFCQPGDGPAAARARALTIAGAEAEGVKLTRNSVEFRYTFAVEETANAPVRGARISVAPFSGPDGAQVETVCKVNDKACAGGAVDVPALGTASVEVSASLPLEGTYKTLITLVYGSRRESTPLVVARARVPLPVEVLGVETARADPLWPSSPSVWLTLGGTPGIDGYSLNPPALLALSLNGPNSSKLQAGFDSVTLTDEAGKEVAQPFSLKDGETRRYRLTVNGLDGAGEYGGTIRVAAPDAKPVDHSVVIVVKKSAAFASLLIGVGVGAGYLIRRYGTRDRPRLLRQRRLLVLASELDDLGAEAGQLGTTEKGVFAAIRRRLDDLYEDLQVGVVTDTDAAANTIDRKLTILPLWVNALHRVDAVRPPRLAEPFRAELDEVKDVLREKEPTMEAVTKAQNTMNTLADRISGAVRDDFTKQLHCFSAEVEKFRQTVTSQPILNDLRHAVEPTVKQAEEFLSAGRMEDARTSFDKARAEYARLLADDLRASLENEAAPLGFDNATWNALKADLSARIAEVSRADSADRATAAYKDAYRHYLQTLADALQGEVERRLKQVRAAVDKLGETDVVRHTETLGANLRRLDSVARLISAGELSAAAGEYKLAKDSLAQTISEVWGTSGKMMSALGAAKMAADARAAGSIPAAAGELPTRAVPTRQSRARPLAADLTKRLRRYDVIVTLCVLVLAVTLGLSTLWVKNPTWGGWDDALAAALWGLGLHQVAGAAFEGLLSFKEKLAVPQAASPGGGT
jgi:hypothetical protein